MTQIISSFGLTDPGKVRGHNEDAFLVSDALRLYAVADGLGGMASGEVASRLAVRHLEQFIGAHADAPATERERLLGRAFAEINRHIIDVGRQHQLHQGMATTLTACWVGGRDAHFVHVGDSTAFLVRDGRAKKISRDHTVTAALTESKLFKPRAAATVWNHVLTRCLGHSVDTKPDLMHAHLHPADTLVLCTDGLLKHVKREEICAALESTADLRQAATALVASANERGGRDNITVVFVRIPA